MAGSIEVHVQSGIKRISITQPSRKNAISPEMSKDLLAAMQESVEDDSRVIILQGAGTDFCAGADLDPSLLKGGFDVAEFLRTTYNPLVLTMRAMNKPILAAVRGSCVGVGFNFALACDMIIAGEDARFSQIFARIGLSTDGGGSYFMLERLGYHKAFELINTAKILDAAEAESLGLVNQVVKPEAVEQTVNTLASQLAQGPMVAIRHNKANLRAGVQGGLEGALKAEAKHQGENFLTEDFMEGVAAFIQKRKPDWKGK